jgi:hypothetical protein
MNIQFQKSTIWLIVRASLALSLSGTVLGQQAPSEKPAAILLTFSPHDSEISCPKEVHAKDRCLLVTGKNVEKRSLWSKFRRTAFLDVPGSGVPAGCVGAMTSGSLLSAQGELHFKGSGYYCPKTWAAVYHCSFDEADAQKFGVPVDLTINYDGRRDTETFTLGN